MSVWFLSSFNLLKFIFFHVFFILFARNNIIFGLTNETDQHALLAVKDLIVDNSLSVLNSWNHSLHFCQWKGVTCSRRRQRVTMLNLSSLNLAGVLSPHSGNLTFLKKIHLEKNNFHGEIPHEIGHLYRLQRLALYQNYFSGNLPTNLSHCLDISEIKLNGNNIGGYVPTKLGSLSNLQELDLSVNKFIGPIPQSLGNLSSLHTLRLDTNKLVGNIPWKLSLLLNLKVLNLGDNNLSGMVPLPIYNISSIQKIELYQNQLQGELPPYLGLTLPNLIYLVIEVNEFSGSFPLSITNASKLSVLAIGKNSFTGPLPMNLGSLHNLRFLSLYRNQLGTNKPNELSILVKSLMNITNLQTLALQENGFKGELPYSIVNLSTTLTWLSLGSDNIFGSLPREIGKFPNLVCLELYDLMLTGSIPSSVGMLSKLERLYLSGNKISGEIPSSIGNITRLAILSFQSNLLEGSIPVELGNLTNLLTLVLSKNRLTGIPEQIVETSSLIVQLFLEENQFTGALPSNMGWLKNLVELVVSKNKFTGEIPSTLGNCRMLESLYLNDNLFQGIIPPSFKQLKSINVMDLSHNNMSGKIPSFLGELKLLRALNLSYNMFEGEVPTKGAFENVSMISVVGNLELCGGIQALKLPTCPMNSPDTRRKSFPNRLIPLLIILPIFILLVSVALILYRLKRRKEQQHVASMLEDQYPRLSYGELHQATNGFSTTNLIGEGRYGSVYKGVLNLGEQIVAVKVLNVEIHGANTSFLAECETYHNILHRNLVKLITSCSSIDFKGCEFKALVLEFMPKGSLDSWLHPRADKQQNNKQLTILQRLSIAIDVASALDYLHHHCHTTIVHCDLKPSNILLDEDFDAHVADFGLTRFLANTKHQQTSSISIKGTIGYIPPVLASVTTLTRLSHKK